MLLLVVGGGGREGGRWREGGRLSCTAAEARRSVEKEAQGHRVVKPGERMFSVRHDAPGEDSLSVL